MNPPACPVQICQILPPDYYMKCYTVRSGMGPGEERSALRLTDRRHPFTNDDSNSLSVAEYRQTAGFATGLLYTGPFCPTRRSSIDCGRYRPCQERQLIEAG